MSMRRATTDAHRALESAVRGDLVRILTKLLKGKTRYDGILIETTGLADPAPVAQTFFVDVYPSTQAAPVNFVQKHCSLQNMAINPKCRTRYDGNLIETQGWLTLHQAPRPSSLIVSPVRAASEMSTRPAYCLQAPVPCQCMAFIIVKLRLMRPVGIDGQGIFSWSFKAAVLFPQILQTLRYCTGAYTVGQQYVSAAFLLLQLASAWL